MDIRRFIRRKENVDESKEFKKAAIAKLGTIAQNVIDKLENKDKRFHDVPVNFERRHA